MIHPRGVEYSEWGNEAPELAGWVLWKISEMDQKNWGLVTPMFRAGNAQLTSFNIFKTSAQRARNHLNYGVFFFRMSSPIDCCVLSVPLAAEVGWG